MKSPRMIVLLCVLVTTLAVSAPLWYIARREDEANKALEKSQASSIRPSLQPFDHQTEEAYRQIGGEPVGWEFRGDWGFVWSDNGRTLPGFKFAAFPAHKLPDVPIPFGLTFQKAAVTAADLRALAHLKTLLLIEFDSRQITDAHLHALHDIGLLHTLNVAGGKDERRREALPKSPKDVESLLLGLASVSDAGLQYLKPLENLKRLTICGPGITDFGLKQLPPFDQLTTLYLPSTQVTDAGLKELVRFPKLTDLRLERTQVTEAGLAELRKAMPQCSIVH